MGGVLAATAGAGAADHVLARYRRIEETLDIFNLRPITPVEAIDCFTDRRDVVRCRTAACPNDPRT